MNEFRKAFRRAATASTAGLKVPARLETYEKRDVLVIPPQNDNGFEIQLRCEEYGVYPSADGWHSGCWDVTVWEPDHLEMGLKEFIDSVSNDAVLEVYCSNSRPYKWILHHRFDGERVADETGMLFFNWFGARSKETYCNGSKAL